MNCVTRLIVLLTLSAECYGFVVPLRMTTTGDYLQSLQTKYNVYQTGGEVVRSKSNKANFVNQLLLASKTTDKKEVEIDTICVNIHKIKCINFNPNSMLISMKLTKEMENIYYMSDEGIVEKLRNDTKISSKAIKNFLAYDFDDNNSVDCIVSDTGTGTSTGTSTSH